MTAPGHPWSDPHKFGQARAPQHLPARTKDLPEHTEENVKISVPSVPLASYGQSGAFNGFEENIKISVPSVPLWPSPYKFPLDFPPTGRCIIRLKAF